MILGNVTVLFMCVCEVKGRDYCDGVMFMSV